MTKRLISIVTPCYNEEGNLEELYRQVSAVMKKLGDYDYEHIFIDNSSTDLSPDILHRLAASDSRVKVIFNLRNFGHIRSPYYAMLQARGEAVVVLAADLQEPPDLVPSFVERWRAGSKIVVGVKGSSAESWFMVALRSTYYRLLDRIANVKLIRNFTGFGLYDREFVEAARSLNDPYPYIRGLISELGFPVSTVEYRQPLRQRGESKNNFYALYDIAMLGVTSHSKVPLRIAAMAGFALSLVSLAISLTYLVLKLVMWNTFDLGLAPLLVGVFFFGAVQLFFIGLLGEYIGAIHTHVMKRPLVVERKRINFDD